MEYLSAFPGPLSLEEFSALGEVVRNLRPSFGGYLDLETTSGDASQSPEVVSATLVYAEPEINYYEDRKTYDFAIMSPLAVAMEVAGMASPYFKDSPRVLEDEIHRILETL